MGKAMKSEGENSSSKAMSDKSEGYRVRTSEGYMGTDNYANSPEKTIAYPSGLKPDVSPDAGSKQQG